MTKNRSRLIVLAIALILFLGLLMLKNQFHNFFPQKTQLLFSTLKKENVSGIVMTNAGKITSLYKKETGWLLKKDGQEFMADQTRINTLIDNVLTLKKDDTVSNNKDKHKDLGIDKQKIELKAGNRSYLIYIGSSTGTAKNYIRFDDEKDVFTATGFDSVFYPDDYRDLLVHFIIDETKINNIEIDYEDKKTALTKKSNDWKIGGKTAKKDRVDFFLNDLKTLKANDILPKETILPGNAALVIGVNEDKAEKHIEFYIKDKENYFVKTSTSVFIFQIPTALVESLKKEQKDFTD